QGLEVEAAALLERVVLGASGVCQDGKPRGERAAEVGHFGMVGAHVSLLLRVARKKPRASSLDGSRKTAPCAVTSGARSASAPEATRAPEIASLQATVAERPDARKSVSIRTWQPGAGPVGPPPSAPGRRPPTGGSCGWSSWCCRSSCCSAAGRRSPD